MSVIYSLIPGMIFIGLAMVVVLVWAVKKGQYEDLEGDGNRILLDDDDPNLPQVDAKRKKDQRMPDADD